MLCICFIYKRTLPGVFYWRAARSNWKLLQELVLIVTRHRLLTNFLCLPDHLICLSRNRSGWEVCLISGIAWCQARKGCLICLIRIFDPAQKIRQTIPICEKSKVWLMVLKSTFTSWTSSERVFYLNITILTAGTMEIWKSGTAWYQAASWSIRHLPDQNQAATWLIRRLPDQNQAAAWSIRTQFVISLTCHVC